MSQQASPGPKQSQPKKKKPTEAQAVAIIAGALAIGAGAEATAKTLSPLIGIPVPSLLAILLLSESRPVPPGIATLPTATATRETQNLEQTYRAHYIWSAAQRVVVALRRGLGLDEAMKPEKNFFNQHIDARSNRYATAQSVDKAAKRYGDTLGWYAKMDSLTSEECREANGKNFSVNRVPAIGWPGSVHPHCRCKPGKAFNTSKTVYSVKAREVA